MSTTSRRTSRKRTVGFLVRIEREYGITQVTGNAVYLATAADTYDTGDVGRICNPAYSDYPRHDAQQYADLRVAAYIKDSAVYGTRHEYYPTSGVELGQARSTTRVLRRIEATLRAQGRAYVAPDDYTGHLLAVADATRRRVLRLSPERPESAPAHRRRRDHPRDH